MEDGVLLEMVAAIAKDGGDIAWELYSGDTVEEATKNTASFASGTWSRNAGLQYKERPQLRGHSCFIKLSNDDDERWAMERLMVVTEQHNAHVILGS